MKPTVALVAACLAFSGGAAERFEIDAQAVPALVVQEAFRQALEFARERDALDGRYNAGKWSHWYDRSVIYPYSGFSEEIASALERLRLRDRIGTSGAFIASSIARPVAGRLIVAGPAVLEMVELPSVHATMPRVLAAPGRRRHLQSVKNATPLRSPRRFLL